MSFAENNEQPLSVKELQAQLAAAQGAAVVAEEQKPKKATKKAEKVSAAVPTKASSTGLAVLAKSGGMAAMDMALSEGSGGGNFCDFPVIEMRKGIFKCASFVKEEVADELFEGTKATNLVFMGWRLRATAWPEKFSSDKSGDKAGSRVDPRSAALDAGGVARYARVACSVVRRGRAADG